MNRLPLLALLLVFGCIGCDAIALRPDCDPRDTALAGDRLADYVIHISVDGLRPDAVSGQLDALPAFARLRT